MRLTALLRPALLAVAVASLAACGDTAQLAVADGTGPDPALPPPSPAGLFPTVNVAPAVGWPGDAMPEPAPGLAVQAFARDLDHPRWLHVLPNGDVLVAESNKPAQAEGGGGIVGWFRGRFSKAAGVAVPSADRVTLLRDADGDGAADVRTVLLSDLHSPFGMALLGDHLYVANTDALVRFPFTVGETEIAAPGETVATLPAGRYNQHWTRNVIASPDGRRLYVAVGSASNIAEHGLEEEEGRAAIWEVDAETGEARVFAQGLRNPVGLAWEPTTGTLWTAVNERDELGSDLVPDYMTSVADGGFYGWPWSYYGRRVDERVQPQRPDLVADAIVPDYALGPHTASLGLAWSGGARLPGFGEGMFVGQHGSWNRIPHSGYKVVFVPFADGEPSGPPVDVLAGFLNGAGQALGRPAGVAVAPDGALLVADDTGNTVWRVAAAEPAASAGR
jgi:glucose/arabinose dehydrogenase